MNTFNELFYLRVRLEKKVLTQTLAARYRNNTATSISYKTASLSIKTVSGDS